MRRCTQVSTLLWSTAVYYPTNNNEPSAIVIIYFLKTSLLHIHIFMVGSCGSHCYLNCLKLELLKYQTQAINARLMKADVQFR